MESLLLFVLVLLLLVLGVPIAVSLGLSSLTIILLFSNDSLASTALKLFNAMEHYTLLAIPFFILSSTFLSTGGVAQRIIRFSVACVGSFRGGLAMAGVFACMMFAALCGSSPATVVAIGSIVIGGMRQVGYSRDFAAGVICNAGTLGILIPPSIVMVVYAAATDVSVGRMFLAGVIPGALAGVMLMVGIYVAAVRRGLPAQPWQGLGEILSAAGDAAWGLFLIVIILGGIYGGIFTPTEAAAVAAVYSFLIAVYVYRDLGPLKGVPWRREGEGLGGAVLRNGIATLRAFLPGCFHADTRKVLVEAARVTLMLMFIIANALLFAHVLTSERIPQVITETFIQAGLSPWMFLVVVNLLLLLGGQFMEPSGLLLIVAPVVFPIAIKLGIDPIHLGIVMVVNMEIGMITPPVGLNLFVTSGITGMSVIQVVRAALPWLGILFVFLILITYVPWISTVLPNHLMGPEVVR
ncbi:C4-dicarboxylate transporter, DctM subunit [Tistlia consotensis]|uniref:TRAP transporter large permease protein n=1 Tax=Tistlia consotensis USBA 355 TaxID=560819 RepID=A0A1Y6B2D7_9PROT|nr:TRAP transporter large permease subunit [Tistlia consotensis]SME88010.1 C4-dicarboxylate transporter, DctM subunit [Tistlia consotensis USBA 355]SNR24358.1 C4-dicarboxylate transporter, DctM subunit [Tistlia consotensis]